MALVSEGATVITAHNIPEEQVPQPGNSLPCTPPAPFSTFATFAP
jgi:hypothetical protein